MCLAFREAGMAVVGAVGKAGERPLKPPGKPASTATTMRAGVRHELVRARDLPLQFPSWSKSNPCILSRSLSVISWT